MKRSLFTILAVVALIALPQLIPNVQMTPTDQTAQSAQIAMNVNDQITPSSVATNTANKIAANTTDVMQNAISFAIPITGMTATISSGGRAMAWNLLVELCGMGWDDMCDLYNHGLSEGWWNE